MVRRGANERQAERDIDRIVKAERLGGDERLIVIHADRHVITLAGGVVEHGVGGQGAEGVDAVLSQPDGRGVDDIAVLGAEGAIFARMWIKTGDGQTWRGDPEFFPKVGVDNAAGGYDQFLRQRCRHILEWDMDCDRHDANLGPRDHHDRHHRFPRLAQGQIGQKLRMAGKSEACLVKHGFCNRIGDDGGCPAFNRQRDGGFDGLDRRMGCTDMRLPCLYLEAHRKGKNGEGALKHLDGIVRLTGLDIDLDADERRAACHHIGITDEDEGGHAVLLPSCPGGNGDIGTDTGWIALCQGKRQGCMCHGKTRLSYQYQVLTICAFLRSSSIYFFSFGFSPSLAFIRSSALKTISAA
ncbi:hypothetical protein AT6N2_C1239 [Agrobacterium tumefaciens]|nr:hypothetical protein AT6N2_C1239 [Agrobacterium tumefaciens]